MLRGLHCAPKPHCRPARGAVVGRSAAFPSLMQLSAAAGHDAGATQAASAGRRGAWAVGEGGRVTPALRSGFSAPGSCREVRLLLLVVSSLGA